MKIYDDGVLYVSDSGMEVKKIIVYCFQPPKILDRAEVDLSKIVLFVIPAGKTKNFMVNISKKNCQVHLLKEI